MPRPNPFGYLAAGAAALLVVGSGLYWLFALTFGLISGLVVLMAPVYPLLAQALLTAVVACLCFWRERPVLGFVLGAPLVMLPGLGAAGWYGWESYACTVAPDPEACFAYLNGSPLLPIGVGAYVLAGFGQLALLAAAAFAARRYFAQPAAPTS